MAPKSRTAAGSCPTQKSAESASKPEINSLIYAMAKHAFTEEIKTPTEPTESDSRVQEVLGLYGILEARGSEAQKMREWSGLFL